MNRKIFLDINIIIDIIDEARTSHQEAKETLVKIIEEDFEVFVSEDMITTVYYILKGNIKVLHFFKAILKKWNVVPFGHDVIASSIDFCIQNQSDLEDTMQCLCAKKMACEIFLTSDKKFIDCGVLVLSYKEFLK